MTAPMETRRSLVAKLSEVMGEVEHVPKRGRNDFHRYDYATEADIVAAVRAGLAKRHVMLIPSVQSVAWREVAGKNGVQHIATLMVRFAVTDGDSGEVLEVVVPGEGQDAGDKCVYKALTGALKYALLKLFLIPTGDDPEAEPEPKRQPAPRTAPQAPKSAPPPAPSPAPPPGAMPLYEQLAVRIREADTPPALEMVGKAIAQHHAELGDMERGALRIAYGQRMAVLTKGAA